MKSASWKDLKHRVREQEGRNFEREVEKLLRPRFPDIVQTPARQRLDRAGIDLVSRDTNGAIQVAVQCKGFEVTLPTGDQTQQAKESILAFLNSKESAELFIFAHNRDGRAREFATDVQALLQALIASGKCKFVEYYDLDTLLNRSRADLRARLSAALRSAAKRKLDELRDLFDVAGDPLLNVPATERHLFLGLTTPPRLEDITSVRSRNVRELLVSRSDTKFTLLIGAFGTGKSTAGLLAASASGEPGPTIIFADCSYFSVDRLGSGLSVLLEEALRAADVFSDLHDADQELFRLAAPLLREQLGNRGQKLGTAHPYVFVLDGLDENRLYARPEGMALLTNSLADLHCPIVLTTRREHFIATFESMKTGLLIFSKKHGWKKSIRVFSLEPWGRDDVQRFVEGSAKILELNGRIGEAAKLLSFVALLQEEKDKEFYGNLVSHPLFLRLILDDIAANGIRKIGRARLLWEWSMYKINRDIERKARDVTQGWRFERDFSERMMMIMEDAAFYMTIELDGTRMLTEYMHEIDLKRIATQYFPAEADVTIAVILNSLLVPRHLFENAQYTIHFVYRIFHEFFLACYAVRKGIALDIPATHVAEFIAELRAGNFAFASVSPQVLL